ncbi:MAG: hypothetical protein A2V66_10920, partial [Ignavibacteria bacterium RBG_13_36_8]
MTSERTPSFFLRISAAPNCNLRCEYCNPDGEFKPGIISDKELLDSIKAGYRMGIRTVHFTGGEPTLRKGIVDLVAETKNIGIEKISLTTNGVLFNKMAENFKKAGLTGASISLDSLDSEKVREITGFDVFKPVYESIVKSCDLFPNVVVNMVVMRKNLSEIKDFVDFADKMEGRFIPRFCELQNFGPAYEKDPDSFVKNHVPRVEIIQALEAIRHIESKFKESRDSENAHAEYFELGNDGLVVGVIAPFSKGWPCAGPGCGRIRIGPTGAIKSCVFNPTYQLDGLSSNEKLDVLEIVIEEK